MMTEASVPKMQPGSFWTIMRADIVCFREVKHG